MKIEKLVKKFMDTGFELWEGQASDLFREMEESLDIPQKEWPVKHYTSLARMIRNNQTKLTGEGILFSDSRTGKGRKIVLRKIRPRTQTIQCTECGNEMKVIDI